MARRGNQTELPKEDLVLHRHGFEIVVPNKILRNGILPIKVDAVLNNVDTISVITADVLSEIYGISITKEAV